MLLTRHVTKVIRAKLATEIKSNQNGNILPGVCTDKRNSKNKLQPILLFYCVIIINIKSKIML